MVGYSGTPLPKKLGIKPQSKVLIVDCPASVRAELRDALSGSSEGAPTDFAIAFVKKQSDLKKHFVHMQKQLAPAGMFWVSWPKKSSGVASDLDENVIRKIGLDAGLVDVKVCAVDEVWSGLKFVRRKADR
jgi:hypothetical protein